MVNFPLAVGRNKKNGHKDKQNDVDFIKCIAWNGLAKICSEYLKKGRLVAIEGKLQIRKYEINGSKRSAAEVVVDNMQMLDKKFFEASAKDDEPEAEEFPQD